LLALEYAQNCTAGEVEELHRPIVASGDKQSAIMFESRRVGDIPKSRDGTSDGGRTRIDNDYRGARGGCNVMRREWGEGEVGDRGGMRDVDRGCGAQRPAPHVCTHTRGSCWAAWYDDWHKVYIHPKVDRRNATAGDKPPSLSGGTKYCRSMRVLEYLSAAKPGSIDLL
jgi:hypothetical protein